MSYLSEKGWGPVSDTLHNTTRGKRSPVSIYTHSNRLQLGRSFRLSVGCAWLSPTGCSGCPQQVVPVIRGLCRVVRRLFRLFRVVHNGLCRVVRRLSASCAWLFTTVVPVVRLQLSDLHTLVYGGRGQHTELLITNTRTTCCAGCAQHVVPARTTFHPPYKTKTSSLTL